MKKTSNRLHSLFAALAALVLAAALAVPAFAVEGGFADLYYRMNDSAGVLTEDEDNELEDALEELSLRQNFDVVIATIESLESVDYDSMEAYADDLYDFCQFGYGPDMDGVHQLLTQDLDRDDRAFRHRAARADDGFVDVRHAACSDQLPDRVQAIEGFPDQIIHAPPPSVLPPEAGP